MLPPECILALYDLVVKGYSAIMAGLTSAGFTARRAAELRDTIADAFEAHAGWRPDFDRRDVYGSLRVVMATLLEGTEEAVAALYDAFDVNNATGLNLSNLALIVGVVREPATYSTADLTPTGTSGTVVPAGSLFQGGGTDGRARWRSTADATLPNTIPVQAEVIGAVAADPGDIATIVTPIAGLTSVTNASAASTGQDEETDEALRQRRQRSLNIAGGCQLSTIRANVLALDFVTACTVLENTDSASASVGGLTMPGGSVAVVVHPTGLTTAQQQSLIATIYAHVAGGIETHGTNSGTVAKGDGYDQTVEWGYASELTVNVATTVTLESGYVLGDVNTAVAAAIASYMLTLGVGDAVRQLDIAAAIATVDGVAGATVTLNGSGGDLTPAVTQIAVIGTNTVST